MDQTNDIFGTASVFVFLAMFGGSTFFLFLLCYFCQKKIQNDDIIIMDRALSQVYVIPTPNQSAFGNNPSLSAPPPDYNSVVRKDSVIFMDSEPPSYETAIAILAQDNKEKPFTVSVAS